MASDLLKGIESVLKKISRAKVLVFGDVMIDKFVWGSVERISPEAPVPVVWAKRQSMMPGGAANVARNLAAIGAKAYLCGVIGKDKDADDAKAMLKECGIDTSMVVEDKTRCTTVKTRVVAHSQQVVRIDWEDITPICEKTNEIIWNKIKQNMDSVDALIVEDYGKGLITKKMLSKLIPYAHKSGKVISVDPKKDHFTYYKGVEIITPNKKELADAVGASRLDTMQEVDKAAKSLMKQLELKGVLVTLSENGMKLYYGKRTYQVPALAKEVYDVSGAGDTVIAVFTACRAVGADPLKATFIANAAASVVVEKVGVATAGIDEIMAKSKETIKMVA